MLKNTKKQNKKPKKAVRKPPKPITKRIEVSDFANRILDEIQKEESVNSLKYQGGRSVAVLVDELLDVCFLQGFLFRHIDIRQFSEAKTYKERAMLLIFYLRAKRGVKGYTLKETSGVFVSPAEMSRLIAADAKNQVKKAKRK